MAVIHIPDGFRADVDSALGLAEALAAGNKPVAREFTLDVSEETLDYWERVRRKRVAEVVLVIPDGSGRYLVHTKAFYPDGAYRLLSGGIKGGERLMDAVAREAQEETSHELNVERFLGVIWTTFCHADRDARFTTYLFELAVPDGAVESLDASEQITGYRFASVDELETLADDLERLEPGWIDWGRFRAAGHRLAVELLRAP